MKLKEFLHKFKDTDLDAEVEFFVLSDEDEEVFYELVDVDDYGNMDHNGPNTKVVSISIDKANIVS